MEKNSQLHNNKTRRKMENFNGLDPVELLVDIFLDPEEFGKMAAEALVITAIIIWYKKSENRKFVEDFNKKYPLINIQPPIIKDLVKDKNLLNKWINIISSVEQAREEKEVHIAKMAIYN